MSDPPIPPTPGRAPAVIGMLGGIASGKTHVARLLAGDRGWVVCADELAHEVLEEPDVRLSLVHELGPEVLGPDGRLDRAALAARVFDVPELRRRLEAWIHPRVRAKILAVLEEARAQGVERVVLDVPLLLENDAQHGLVSRCDHLVFVDAPAAERDRRAALSRGWPPGEVARREAFQLPLSEKRKRADVVIVNDGTSAELAAAVELQLRALGLE